MKANMFSRLD